jgi:hypothetical protein
MDNIKIFKEFWNSYTTVLLNLYDRNNEDSVAQKLEDLIYETKDVFVKNTSQKTGKEFSSKELAEVATIVASFIKS